jgi:magnesium-transporting ATPase (P-type)
LEDKKANSRKYTIILPGGESKTVQSKEIKVGDLIYLTEV